MIFSEVCSCIGRYAIHGDSSDGAVEETPGLVWAKDRQQRGPLPGQEVGQHIICCNAQATLSGEYDRLPGLTVEPSLVRFTASGLLAVLSAFTHGAI